VAKKLNSRAKGASGERQAAKAWSKTFNVSARRGCQFSGGPESPDIVTDHKEIHVEVKRTEKGNPYNWIAQAVVDARGKIPCVLHRRNNEEWILILRLEDAPRFAETITKQGTKLADENISSEIQTEDTDSAGDQDA
tara:strand:+ start:80 stop:490 length:411 start_codon:yes stop_codon:yes gene_type:complete